MKKYNVLLLGQGGREHAFAKKLKEDPSLNDLYISKGNAGTALCGTNVNLSNSDFEAIGRFCIEKAIEIVIVGPEKPLVEGIFDFFQNNNDLSSIRVLGPSKLGAQLEGSKSFAKSFMLRHGVPTAGYQSFNHHESEKAIAYLSGLSVPLVIKADGLAGGKGVIIAQSHSEGMEAISNIFSGQFNEAGNQIVIEEFMVGIEFSVFTLTDGKLYKILPVAKDYKRIGEGDTGLNTGGMGAVSPPPFVTDEVMKQVELEIIQPTIKGLIEEDITYYGFIYFGLMLCTDGKIKVVEYNCRMGDPETQVVLPRLKNNLIDLTNDLFDGKLENINIEIDEQAAVTSVLVSGGYPRSYEKGKRIDFPISLPKNVEVFHSGTDKKDDSVVTNGGRVLSVTAFGNDWHMASDDSKSVAEMIDFEGKYFRTDIGFDL